MNKQQKIKQSRKLRSTYKYQQMREAYLRENPYCVHCENEGIPGLANEIDHIIPIHKNPDIDFFDQSNWQSLCKHHHKIKSDSEMEKTGKYYELKQWVRELIDE